MIAACRAPAERPDAAGAHLDGCENYKLAVQQPVRGKLAWSVTVYDSATRSRVQTDQGKMTLRSLFELNDVKSNAPLDLNFGPPPPADQEGRWIKTAPGRDWFAYIRICGPEAAAFNKNWKPGDFDEFK